VADRISKKHRSWVMSRIRSKGSVPERTVRAVLHRMGFRYRLHVKNLPGKPDLVFKKHNLVIFVNGCFWHQHQECKDGRIPKSNREYWVKKFDRNVSRDRENQKKLEELGWQVEVIWECETKNWSKLISRIHEIFPSLFNLEKALERLEDQEIGEVIENMRSGVDCNCL